MTIESRITLCPGTPRIDVRTVVGNTAEDHRLRVLFPLGAPARFGSSEGIFSVDDRPSLLSIRPRSPTGSSRPPRTRRRAS